MKILFSTDITENNPNMNCEAFIVRKDNESLNIPADAVTMDVLSYHYSIKNNKVRFSLISLADALPLPVSVFNENDMLCISPGSFIIGIRRDEIKGVRRIKKSMTLGIWDKTDAPASDKYREFKLKSNLLGHVLIRWYYIIDIEKDGEQYMLYVPSYERDAVERVLGSRQ